MLFFNCWCVQSLKFELEFLSFNFVIVEFNLKINFQKYVFQNLDKINRLKTYNWIWNVQRRYAWTSTRHRLMVERTCCRHNAKCVGTFCSVHVF